MNHFGSRYNNELLFWENLDTAGIRSVPYFNIRLNQINNFEKFAANFSCINYIGLKLES